jgi:hypothetical protein
MVLRFCYLEAFRRFTGFSKYKVRTMRTSPLEFSGLRFARLSSHRQLGTLTYFRHNVGRDDPATPPRNAERSRF